MKYEQIHINSQDTHLSCALGSAWNGGSETPSDLRGPLCAVKEVVRRLQVFMIISKERHYYIPSMKPYQSLGGNFPDG